MHIHLLRVLPFVVAPLLAASAVFAQDIVLDSPGAAQIWRGSAGSQAGAWLEQAAVGEGDVVRDLIIGSPAWSGNTGRVTVVYRGPLHSGTATLDSAADSTINGVVAGARFGAVTASGFLFNHSAGSAAVQRDLIVSAPGSGGDAGRVYIFAGPIRRGTRDASSARSVITGTAGERFGAALASADLNDDGFREVIVGAPGSNRIYVFDPTALPAGAVTTASASMVLVADPSHAGHGFGEVIEAGGDVTGDGVYDLAIGVPRAAGGRGVVLLVRGRANAEAWSFPGTVSATSAASAMITGVHPGDRAGQSLTFRDIVFADGGVRDLIIGAPGGDGAPSAVRPDAGAVYVLWGGSITPGCDLYARGVLCTRVLDTPDVVMHGAAAGLRTGEGLAGGDITRDNPDDLVLVAPGGAAGVELYVIYGTRLRTTYGAVVDLARDGEYGRRMIGRGIESVVVYEATGEGANDIIVGVPSGDSGSGLVYVAISPKIQVSSRTLSLTAGKCALPWQTIEVRNPSVVPLPWEIRTSVPWLRVVPGTGSSMSGAPVPARVAALTADLPVGSHSGSFDVVSTTRHVAMFIRVTVQLTVQAASPLPANAHADFGSDGCGDVAVFQPGTGQWHVPGAAPFTLGAIGDVALVGDFDGNGSAEPVVYRRSTSTWRFRDSEVTFGEVGDIPVPADYDGDGIMEIAVFRPSTGRWLIQGLPSVDWGGPGDTPVPADYDGDGDADVAVFVRGTATWRIRGQAAVQWGAAADLPVPADYDGDGDADLAVYRRATGTWFVKDQLQVVWGAPNDVPMPIDVTRDGRADLIVFHRATGGWSSYDPASGVTSTGAPVAGSLPVVYGGRLVGASIGAAPLPSPDLDGDRRADLTVWRGGWGMWYTVRSGRGFANDALIEVRWGSSAYADVPVNADYDGDGRVDIAVWRPAWGYWYILRSSQNYSHGAVIARQWGSGAPQYDDVPVPADYDGDGRADIAVWRRTTGDWYILPSSGAATMVVRWGLGTPPYGDRPVVGDYDGDGRADIGVWRPGTGMWYVLLSSASYDPARPRVVQWGSGLDAYRDQPVTTDYDGDGRTDIAVWRAATGMWYVQLSAGSGTEVLARSWGSGAPAYNDRPVPADYDGDGRAEIAVWRPATGMWYVITSSTAYSGASVWAKQWGSGAREYADQPVVPR